MDFRAAKCNLRSFLQVLSVSMGSTLGETYYSIFALRSQIFEYLRKTFGTRAVRVSAIGSFRQEKKKTVFLQKRVTIIDIFWRPVVGGDTFSPLAPVLGPEQKTGDVTLFHSSWRSAWHQTCDIRVEGAGDIRRLTWTSSYTPSEPWILWDKSKW